MNSFERRFLFCVAGYTLFLSLACPLLCVAFFRVLETEEAIAATVVLFMFAGLMFLILYWIASPSITENPKSISSNANTDADRLAAKMAVEKLYSELKRRG